MRIKPVKLEHFVSFITSPHVIQDVPFGEKLLKLWTGEIIKTPNVIRTIIPECISSVRKSLQGLDNFSASGMEAVDAIEKLVDKLVDCGKTQQ